MYPKTVTEVTGFESLHGFDEDMMYVLQNFLEANNISSEFTGTLRFTIEYIEDNNEV